jgi:hypothetical protein
MINSIVAVSNPHAVANFSKLIRTYHINRLKHDTKSRKKGKKKRKKKEKRKERTVTDMRLTKENQKLSLHRSSQAVPARPYEKDRQAVK